MKRSTVIISNIFSIKSVKHSFLQYINLSGNLVKELSQYCIYQVYNSGISIKRPHYKADTSIRRTVWRGIDCFALRLNYLRKNLYKADTLFFLHQWCPLYRDSTELPHELLRARLHETRSELKAVWDFTSGYYQRSHDFERSETHFGANFTLVNLTEVKIQTAVSFPCKQQVPAAK